MIRSNMQRNFFKHYKGKILKIEAGQIKIGLPVKLRYTLLFAKNGYSLLFISQQP